jgi:hypothetical protein
MSNRRRSYTAHHRKCRSNGGDNSCENVVRIPDHIHTAWHVLFKNWEAETIAEYINKFLLDPEFKFIVKRR